MKTPRQAYTDLIFDAYIRRHERNKTYSLRAFARDLKLTPAYLSLLLAHQRGISHLTAEKVADKLDFTFEVRKYFLTCVTAAHSRNKKTKREAIDTLLKYPDEGMIHVVTDDQYAIYEHWSHYALLSYLDITGGKLDSKMFAQRLNLSEEEVLERIATLVRVGILKNTDGLFIRQNPQTQFSNGNEMPEPLKRCYLDFFRLLIAETTHRPRLTEWTGANGILSVDLNRIGEMRQFLHESFQTFFYKFHSSSPDARLITYAFALTAIDNP